MTLSKEIMRLLGFVDGDDVVNAEVDVNYRMDIEENELAVTARMEIPDEDWIEQLTNGVVPPGLLDVEQNGSEPSTSNPSNKHRPGSNR